MESSCGSHRSPSVGGAGVVGQSLVKPWNFGIGKAHFSAGAREGWTLAPGGITDGEILRFPNQNIYSWHVKIGKRKLWTCSVIVDKGQKK